MTLLNVFATETLQICSYFFSPLQPCKPSRYYCRRFRSQEKRLQNLSCLATMAQQCAVAGHIVGMVQERSNAGVNIAVTDEEDHGRTGMEHAEDAVSLSLKPTQTLNTTDSQCVQVPVELKLCPQTLAMNYYHLPSSPDYAFDIRSQPAASLSGRQSNELAAGIYGLSRDTVNENQTRRCRPTNDETPAAGAGDIIDRRTSTATGLTSLVLHGESSSPRRQKRLTASSNSRSRPRAKLLSGDKLFPALKTSTACCQQSHSTKQTPSSDVDLDQLSDSDNCSDVWVPRTLSAAEAVSGISICGRPYIVDSLRSAGPSTVRQLHRAYKLRAELESPDPVFRRRVAVGYPRPTKWCRAGALDFGGRSPESVDRRLTARERRRAWRVSAEGDRIRHIDSESTLYRDNSSVLSQYTSPPRSGARVTSTGRSIVADAGLDGVQETPIVQLIIDGGPRAKASTDNADDAQQQVNDSRNTEQPLDVPVSATATSSAALMSSLLERLTSFRHGRSSVHDERHKQHKIIENRARKALRTISIILGAFIICWTPWHILSLIIGFCGETCVSELLYDISYWLCYLNSPLNPFCYALANHQFKKTFLRILRFDWHRN